MGHAVHVIWRICKLNSLSDFMINFSCEIVEAAGGYFREVDLTKVYPGCCVRLVKN